MPGPQEGVAAKRVAARPAGGVPPANGKAQVIGHGFAHDLLGLVIVAEGQI